MANCLSQNYQHLRARIARACQQAGRPEKSVQILPVSKYHGPTAIQAAWLLGFKRMGESRVAQVLEKQTQLKLPLQWEFIGTLQSNKAKKAVELCQRVASVDRPKLLRALARASSQQEKRLAILLQINPLGETSQGGVAVQDAPALLEAALEETSLKVEGLMCLAPLKGGEKTQRSCFATLRTLRDRLQADFSIALPELSAGMSGDLEAAILEGSTQLRVGTALFGKPQASP